MLAFSGDDNQSHHDTLLGSGCATVRNGEVHIIQPDCYQSQPFEGYKCCYVSIVKCSKRFQTVQMLAVLIPNIQGSFLIQQVFLYETSHIQLVSSKLLPMYRWLCNFIIILSLKHPKKWCLSWGSWLIPLDETVLIPKIPTSKGWIHHEKKGVIIWHQDMTPTQTMHSQVAHTSKLPCICIVLSPPKMGNFIIPAVQSTNFSHSHYPHPKAIFTYFTSWIVMTYKKRNSKFLDFLSFFLSAPGHMFPEGIDTVIRFLKSWDNEKLAFFHDLFHWSMMDQ